jgi:hypothetical protein
MAHRIMVVPRHGEHPEHHEGWAQHHGEIVDPVGVAGDEGGAEDDEGELGRLRRLELEEPEADPALRAVDVHADAGDEHGDEQAERAEHQDRDHAGPAVVVEAGTDDHRHGADDQPHALADEHGERGADLFDGPHRRRREDHHRAEQAEDRHHHHQGEPEPLRGRGPGAVLGHGGRPGAPWRGHQAQAGTGPAQADRGHRVSSRAWTAAAKSSPRAA